MAASFDPEWASGNIFIRRNRLSDVGDRVMGHKHKFDHTTFIIKGAVHVVATLPDGRVIERDFEAGEHFLTRADVLHEITATLPNTVFNCVYSHRDPQGRIVQTFNGWTEAYV